MPVDSGFHRGKGGLLRYAIGRLCSDLKTQFKRDLEKPMYSDKYGLISVPVTDGYQSFYVVARGSIYYNNEVGIERGLVERAKEYGCKFLMYVDSVQEWWVFDPVKILERNQKEMRGHIEYLVFHIAQKEGYQRKFF